MQAGPGAKGASMLLRAAGLPFRLIKSTALGTAYLRLAGLAKSRMKTVRQLVHPQTTLTWKISVDSIVETGLPSSGRFGLKSLLTRAITNPDDDSPKVTILNALTALYMAADDPRVTHLDVRVVPAAGTRNRPVSLGLGLAQAQELLEAVLEFNRKKAEQYESGNWGSSFTIDSFDDQLTYYFASAFNKIVVQPTGQLPLTGISWTLPYYKKLLDKVGIEVQTGSRMEYNSASAPFTESDIPDKHKDNGMSILYSLNDIFLRTIAHSRASSIAALRTETADKNKDPYRFAQECVHTAMTQHGPYIDAQMAKRIGLITDVGGTFFDDEGYKVGKCTGIGAYVKARRQEIERESHGTPVLNAILDRLTQLVRGQAAANMAKLLRVYRSQDRVTVGVVYLHGSIERGGEKGANLVCKSIIAAAKDPEVLSIVIRVDSAGGDFVASSAIASAVLMAQTKYGKPVIASYGNTATSGAYLATAYCGGIFANSSTLTGGIGVSSTRPVVTKRFTDLFELGIRQFNLTGPSTNWFELEGEKLEAFKSFVDNTYGWFIADVARGRQMSQEEVESVAQGQVFTGLQARGNKVVDKLGVFADALETAAQSGYENRANSLHYMTGHYLQSAIASTKTEYAAETDPILKDGKYRVPSEVDPRVGTKVRAVFTDELTQAIFDRSYLDMLDDPTYKYKADITKNIRIKEFSTPATSTSGFLSLIAKLVGGDLVREAVASALRQERDSLASTLSAVEQPRAEADIMNIK
ncbi:hypothetical protein GGH92_004076 [Coemansia sp. RSA 2673]|nr:hypothetical protein GGH92_004076 [Coemansia sp. RSA 2673]